MTNRLTIADNLLDGENRQVRLAAQGETVSGRENPNLAWQPFFPIIP
jgi:hypothetical protein